MRIESGPAILRSAKNLARAWLKRSRFPGSNLYWNKRYESGGDSGHGSGGELARFKADVINRFVSENRISSVLDFGCGDGRQLSLLKVPRYLGFDVSQKAIDLASRAFEGDPTKTFKHLDEYRDEKAELVLSLDVIYHLIEDPIFESHMNRLFLASEKFVIVYSSNTKRNPATRVSHIKHRRFTDWIEKHRPDWRLDAYIKNQYPFLGDDKSGSFADFYIFSRLNDGGAIVSASGDRNP